MRSTTRYLSLLLTLLALFQAGRTRADGGACFDFASPTLDGLLQPSSVQRLVIATRISTVDTRLAARSLSLVARHRGIDPIIVRNSEMVSPRDLAFVETRANQAQLAAIITVSTGDEPLTATAELRDRDGNKLVLLTGVRSEDKQCQESEPTKALQGRGLSEWESIERTPPIAPGSRLPEAAESRSSDEGPGHTWYGWQLLLADTGSLLLLLNMPPLSAFTYLGAPPAIHAANGQGRRAWWSVGLRLGIPLAGAGLGLLAASGGSCDKQSDDQAMCGFGLIVGGFVVGMFVAAIIDDTALAWKVTEDSHIRFVSEEPRPARKSPAVSLGVGVLPYRGGAGLGMAGRF